MKVSAFGYKNLLPAMIFFLFTFPTCRASSPKLSREKLTLLKVVTGIHLTFQNCASQIWPGYDLSKTPYLAYLPGEFVLYLNASSAPKDFQPYPADWLPLPATAFIHFGVYQNLAGQFAFDFQLDSTTTFAMGLPKNLLFSSDNPSRALFGSTIHEGFHQFQRHHFGEIPWAREELYPILDVENSALASLEMHILKDALKTMFANNRQQMEMLLKEFVAVREYRWKNGSQFISKYEQGQEINEGTARYVEMKALDCFLKLDARKIDNQLFRELKKDFTDISMEDILLADMEARLNGLAVAPEDMLRNRIYPVGAALGFLLDQLKIHWKARFQAGGPHISFSALLQEYFKLDSRQLSTFFRKAQSDYNYQRIVRAASTLIKEYNAGYQKALHRFNRQKGIRIEILLSGKGMLRFRSTKDKKWVVENGSNVLCLYYNLYSLKSLTDNRFQLEIHDKAIYEENDWERERKKIVFYADNISSLMLNGASIELNQKRNQKFKKLKIKGGHFLLIVNTGGKFIFTKKGLTIYLE